MNEPSTTPVSTARVATLAGALVLASVVGFALHRWINAPSSPPETSTDATDPGGTAIVETTPPRMTPEASIVAERYMCMCGCELVLGGCICSNTPGSRDMKAYLQSLVGEKMSMEEIDRAMVEKYGEDVLLEPSAAP